MACSPSPLPSPLLRRGGRGEREAFGCDGWWYRDPRNPTSRSGMFPGLAVSTAEMLRRIVIVHDQPLLRVIHNRMSSFHGDVCQDAACRRDVAFFNVGDRAAALLDGVEEIAHVPARCGRGVQFDIGLGYILGILLA